MREPLRRMLVVACLAAAAAGVSASRAPAAVVGQVGPAVGLCTEGVDWVQPNVASGNSYVVPAIPPTEALSITSWSHVAYTGAGQRLKLKVYRPVAGLTFTVVAEDVRDLTQNVLNTFSTDLPVRAGDVLGITTAPGSPLTGCGFGTATTVYSSSGDHAVGTMATFGSLGGYRLNISAVVEPTNRFSFGPTARNKKRGTATLTLEVPNPGELTVTGKGVRAASAASATKAVTVAAGAVKVKVKAAGQQRKKLNRTGKVTLAPSVTYTPTGGSPENRSTKLRLRKR